jgi:hypothetical protein
MSCVLKRAPATHAAALSCSLPQAAEGPECSCREWRAGVTMAPGAKRSGGENSRPLPIKHATWQPNSLSRRERAGVRANSKQTQLPCVKPS